MRTQFVNEARAIFQAAITPQENFLHLPMDAGRRRNLVVQMLKNNELRKTDDGLFVITPLGYAYMRATRPLPSGIKTPPRTFVPVGSYRGMTDGYARAGAGDALRVRSLSPFSGGF